MTDLNKEREAFEVWFKTTEMHKALLDYIATHQPNLKSPLVKSGKSYRNSMVQASWMGWQEKAKAQAVPEWISAEVGRPIKFGTRVKIKRKAWDEDDNLIIVESEATYDKDSDFCELSNRSYEYETWFDHELKKYLDEDELTHWAPLDKSESGAEG